MGRNRVGYSEPLLKICQQLNISEDYAWQVMTRTTPTPIRSLLTAVAYLFLAARSQGCIVTLKELSDLTDIRRRVIWKKIKSLQSPLWAGKPMLVNGLYAKYERILNLTQSQRRDIRKLIHKTKSVAPCVAPKTILIYSISSVVSSTIKTGEIDSNLRTLKNLCHFFDVSTTCYYRLKHRMEKGGRENEGKKGRRHK